MSIENDIDTIKDNVPKVYDAGKNSLKKEIGDLDELNTAERDNLVDAINEVDGYVTTLDEYTQQTISNLYEEIEVNEDNFTNVIDRVDEDIENLTIKVGRNTERISDIRTDINEITKSSQISEVFDNYRMLIDKLSNPTEKKYKKGQSLYIKTLGVPDLWISDVSDEEHEYNYISDTYFVNEIDTNGHIWIKNYELSPLEGTGFATILLNSSPVNILGDLMDLSEELMESNAYGFKFTQTDGLDNFWLYQKGAETVYCRFVYYTMDGNHSLALSQRYELNAIDCRDFSFLEGIEAIYIYSYGEEAAYMNINSSSYFAIKYGITEHSLPPLIRNNTMCIVPLDNGVCDLYIYTKTKNSSNEYCDKFELIGSTKLDLSNYYTKEEISEHLNTNYATLGYVNGEVGEQFGIINSIKANKADVGNLNELNTTEKGNLVDAINQIFDQTYDVAYDYQKLVATYETYSEFEEAILDQPIDTETEDSRERNVYIIKKDETEQDALTIRVTSVSYDFQHKTGVRESRVIGKIERTVVDLSNYYSKEQLDERLDRDYATYGYVNAKKVDKSDVIDYVDGQAETSIPSSKAIHDYVLGMFEGYSDELIPVIGDLDELNADNLVAAINEIDSKSLYINDDGNLILRKKTKTRLPNGYKELEFIQTSGTQWLNTGIYASPRIRIEALITNLSTRATAQYFFGVVDSSTTFAMYKNGSNQWAYQFKDKTYGSFTTGIKSDLNKHKFVIDADTREVSVDGGATYMGKAVDIISNSSLNPIVIGGQNYNGKPQEFSSIKVHEFKIYDYTKLIMHLIPARNPQNILGMYDLINGRFLTNQGTGVFIDGDATELVEIDEVIGSVDDMQFGNYTYSGEKISLKDNYMKVRKYDKIIYNHSNTMQGAANFGKYVFQFHDKNDKCIVYDLENKIILQEIIMPNPNALYHCNNANFGLEYYDASDRFPLLYVSNENENMHNVIVYRVMGDDENMSLQPVQTITMPVVTTNGLFYPNAIIDTQNNLLVSVTLNKTPYYSATKTRYTFYNLPKLSDGDITLNYTDAIKTFELPLIYATQGALIHNSRIYQVSGIPNESECNLKVIDITNESIINSINLKTISLTSEPESVLKYNNKLYVILVNGYIYELEF